MKPSIILCLAALVLPLEAVPEKLSPLDAQLLLERLSELRDGSEKRIKTSYQAAFSAFRSAIQSDAAAHELYLKCVEKVRFTDEKKKAQDFREWKRAHSDNGDTPAFRRALRHQLNWLLLTLEAASEPAKRETLWPKGLENIDLIFKDAEELAGEEGQLRQDVLQTVFATAYSLNGINLDHWPRAPLQISQVYEELILPPLRKASTLGDLKQAWEKRILHEGSVFNLWGRPSNTRGGREGRPVDLDKFLAERRPQLLWEMEVDLFRAGDQKGAALRMLKHIEENVGHKNCPGWIADFEAIVKGQIRPPTPLATDARPGDEPKPKAVPAPVPPVAPAPDPPASPAPRGTERTNGAPAPATAPPAPAKPAA